MKQGVLVTAYKNFHHLEKIIASFDEDFSLYIHIDRKSKLSHVDLERLRQLPSVVLISRKYAVNWGGLHHVQAILHLAEEALKNKALAYLHLISGHDFPIKRCAEIKEFIEKNKEQQFIDFFKLPKEQKGWENGGYGRICSYHFYDAFNAKSKTGLKILDFLGMFQYKWGITRKLKKDFPQLYGGSTWWSLSAPCLQHIIQYVKDNPWYLKRFEFTFCPEEMFFQTIIMNSSFKDKVMNDNLRYILWEERNGNSPANLDLTDLPALISSNALFARKFDYPVSEPLLKQLITSIQTGA